MKFLNVLCMANGTLCVISGFLALAAGDLDQWTRVIAMQGVPLEARETSSAPCHGATQITSSVRHRARRISPTGWARDKRVIPRILYIRDRTRLCNRRKTCSPSSHIVGQITSPVRHRARRISPPRWTGDKRVIPRIFYEQSSPYRCAT